MIKKMLKIKDFTLWIVATQGRTSLLTLKALQKYGFKNILPFTINIIDTEKNPVYDPMDIM